MKKIRGPRKQILLFLAAVILPSLVLVAFGLRMISQERELAQKRAVEERSRMATEIGQHLLVRLEKIKLQESTAVADWDQSIPRRDYVNSEVVLIGHVDGCRLVLPWEADQKKKEAQKLLNSPNFIKNVRRAEEEEFSRKNFSRAAALYSQSLKAAQEPVQKGFARLQLARALMKSRQKKEALKHYQTILALPSAVSDEYGIPFSLYAAERLLEEGESYGEVAERIRAELETKHWISPAESYFIQDLIEKLAETAPEMSVQNAARDFRQMIRQHIQNLEQDLELQSNFRSLGLRSNQRSREEMNEPMWIAYGSDSWLVSKSPHMMDAKPLFIVVKTQEILDSLRSDSGFSESFPVEFRFVTGGDSEGESLGPNFRNVKIAFTADQNLALSQHWSFQRFFYLLLTDVNYFFTPEK